MNAKQLNLTIWACAAGVSLAAAAALLLALIVPLDRNEVSESAKVVPTTRPTLENAVPPTAAFEKIWAMSLRQPLGEAPPPGTTPEPAATVTPGATDSGVPVALVGTIGNTLAMLRTANNSVEVCGVGETLSGVTVLAVRPAEIDVRFNGQIIKLSKPVDAQ